MWGNVTAMQGVGTERMGDVPGRWEPHAKARKGQWGRRVRLWHGGGGRGSTTRAQITWLQAKVILRLQKAARAVMVSTSF